MQWEVEGTITLGVEWRRHGDNIKRRYLQDTPRRTLGTNFSDARLTQSQESTPKKVVLNVERKDQMLGYYIMLYLKSGTLYSRMWWGGSILISQRLQATIAKRPFPSTSGGYGLHAKFGRKRLG